jgi:hypothetical protein
MGLLFRVCSLMAVGGMSRVQAIEGKGGGVIIRFWYRVALIQCRKKAIQ